MGLFDRIFKRRAETAEAVVPDDVLLKALLQKEQITREQALSIPTFAGCVNKICDTVSIIPIRLYHKTDGSTEEVTDDQRVRLLNDDTADTLTGTDFKRAMVMDYLTNKGGYAYISKRGRKVSSINYVDADVVSFTQNADPIHKDYKILVNGAEYDGFRFIKVLRKTKNGFFGTSIIDENSDALNVAYLSMIFEGKLVKRGGNKKGFLESERKLDGDALTELREGFNQMYADDTENAIVLNNGVKFHESSNSSVEMQMNENKKSNATEICKIFGIPPAILSGVPTPEETKLYVQYCIIPIMESFVKAINRDLLSESEKNDYFFMYDVSELTRADIKTRYEAYQIGYKNRFLQIDEIRAMENLPNLDIPFFMIGMNDVLFDPDSGDIFLPNMNQWANIKDPNKYPQYSGTGQQISEGEDSGKEEEGNDESDSQS